MKFGLSAPFRGPLATPEQIRGIAEKAEEFGYDIITVSDHILLPQAVDSKYPYSNTGAFPWTEVGGTDCLEQFTLMAWLLALTKKIHVMSSVAVIPHRNPLFMAKSIASMDVLSGGRVTVGCGAGWMREEFDALNIEDFDARGRVTDEYLKTMKSIWTDDAPGFDGEFIKFGNVYTDPRPIQKPHPQLWIGGESMPAMRRTVALGDVWYPFGSNPSFRMDKPETYRARLEKLHALAEEKGRDPASIGLGYNCAFHSAREQEHVDGGRLCFTGTPEQRIEDIGAFGEAGIQSFVINVMADDYDAMVRRMEEFATNVMPQFR